MDREEHRGERWTIVSGAGFVVLAIVATLMTRGRPSLTSSAEELTRWVSGAETRMLTASFLGAVSVLLFMVFLGDLRSMLRRAEGDSGAMADLAFGTGMAASVIALGAIGLGAGAATLVAAPAPSADLVGAALRLQALAYPLFAVPLCVMLGCAALAGSRTGILPMWVSAIGWIAALTNAVAITSLFVKTGTWRPSSMLWYVAAFLPFMLWTLTASVSVMLHLGRAWVAEREATGAATTPA